MKIRLQELQETHSKALKIRVKRLKKGQKKANGVLYHQNLPFEPKVIQIEFINQHHNDLLAGHFGFSET